MNVNKRAEDHRREPVQARAFSVVNVRHPATTPLTNATHHRAASESDPIIAIARTIHSTSVAGIVLSEFCAFLAREYRA